MFQETKKKKKSSVTLVNKLASWYCSYLCQNAYFSLKFEDNLHSEGILFIVEEENKNVELLKFSCVVCIVTSYDQIISVLIESNFVTISSTSKWMEKK